MSSIEGNNAEEPGSSSPEGETGGSEQPLDKLQGADAKMTLKSTWTIWYDGGGQPGLNDKKWQMDMVTIGSFDTVVGMWNYWNAIDVGQLPNGGNVRWFKQGIQPTWEDPANAKGGRLLVRDTNSEWGDKALMDTMLWIIGYATGKSRYDSIAGFVYSRRRAGSRVEVWTKDASLDFESMATELEEITGGREIEYRDHKGNLTYKHGGGGKKSKKKAAPKNDGAALTIPIPLPKPLPKVDVEAMLNTMPESQERRGSMAYDEFEAFRKSLADDARAARRSIASMHIPEGRGDDYTPCPSPLKGDPNSMPEVELPSPVIEDDGYVLPEKKKKRRKRPVEGGSPSSGGSTPPGSPLSTPNSTPSSPEASSSGGLVLPAPLPKATPNTHQTTNPAAKSPAVKRERSSAGVKQDKAGRRSVTGQDQTGTLMMYGIMALVVAFAGALIFVALKAPAADLAEL